MDCFHSDRVEEDGGTTIQRSIQLDSSGNAYFGGLFSTDNVNINQNINNINVPWAYPKTRYYWDEVEILQNSGSDYQIVKLLTSRRDNELKKYAELIENRLWMTPTTAGVNGVGDGVNPYGIPYWLNFLANGSVTGGFNGYTIRFGDATTSTTCAGITAGPTGQALWNNYASIYRRIDQNFVKEARMAQLLTQFNPPTWLIEGREQEKRNDSKSGLFTNSAVLVELAQMQHETDDDIEQNDLSGVVRYRMGGGPLNFDGMNVYHVPALDTQTVNYTVSGANTPYAANPVYAVDWSKLMPMTLKGYWMRETKPISQPPNHTVFGIFVDSALQFLGINRRTLGWNLHLPIPAST